MPDRVVGIVGLGLVGRALGARLRGQGWRTLGFDLREEASAAFAAEGGARAGSVAQLGRETSCVLLAVFDTHGVLQVLEGEGALLSDGHAVRTVVDCSTGAPELLEALAARLQARGVAFVESPLSGSSQQIERGEATALVGGPATNLVLGLNRAVLAEGIAFAEGLGIPPERFLALVLATPARSDAAVVKGPLMVQEDFAPRSRIRQHLKDVDLMLRGARQAGLDLPFSEVHARLLREAVEAGDGELDNAAIVRRLRGRRTP
jgi:3-hydroxyisobutyrate dehydrogenase-like beta-hydroxyacid dehydrogenase